MPVPLSTVTIGELERRYVLDALESGMISSLGSYVDRFERQIAASVGVRHAVAVSSGTSALELVLRAMGIGPGDEVIVPAFTFVAPALAVALVGAVPRFADVTTETWTIDPDEVRRLRTPRTRAVIAVDVIGHPCDFDALEALGIPIIEDAAEAHGATYRGRPAGSCGTAAIFSFHANKAVTTGEGGCVTTDDAALADRVRQLNAFGMEPGRRYWHTLVGGNHRMTNLVAALGLAQVERWDELVAARAKVAAAYDVALRGLDVGRRPAAEWAGMSTWLYSVTSRRRDLLLQACRRLGVDARAVWPVGPDNPAFARFNPGPCPRARTIAAQAMLLPTWAGMPADAIDQVAAALADASSEAVTAA